MSFMITTEEQTIVATLPELAVPTAERAISMVNHWLHCEVGTAVNVSRASFNSTTYCWHLPIQLAYPDTGPVGVIGDVYLHAATGEFIGLPDADELLKRTETLAYAYGITAGGDEKCR
jgi:hypothetical protein